MTSNEAKTVMVTYKYRFNEKELADLSQEMAETVKSKAAKDTDRKSAATLYKAQIDELDARIIQYAEKISIKCEQRKAEAVVRLNQETKKREYWHADEGTLLYQEDFRPGDNQRRLPMD